MCSVIIEGFFFFLYFFKSCILGGVKVKWPVTCDFLYKPPRRNIWSRILIFWNLGDGYMGLVIVFSLLLCVFDHLCNKTNCMWMGVRGYV